MSSNGDITVRLPDGTEKKVSHGSTVKEVAESIGPGLAKAALAGQINGQTVDLGYVLEADAKLVILTPRDENDDALAVIRHSTAHVMAEAIQRLYPETKLVYGPPVDDGFYYDIDLKTPISSNDFEKIEQEMANIVEEDRAFSRYELDPEEGMARLREEGNIYKIDNAERALEQDANAKLSWYATGVAQEDWEDLCRGPHVPSTGRLGAFKVMSVARSHWKGDVTSEPLQRVYGTAFATPKGLKGHLARLEEAKDRDHRVIGQKLGLFVLDEQVGPGLVLWKPKGAMVRNQLEEFLKKKLFDEGYDLVYTPHIGKIDLYKMSGHYPYYSDSQFPPIKMRGDDTSEYLLRPMNCPHHIKIYASEPRSYRDLPVRLAEFGTCYRFEQSGELTGMTRVRGLTIDDAHIFCTEDQVQDEIRSTIGLVRFVFETFGFEDVSVALSLRDPDSEKYTGDPEIWDRAEGELREVLKQTGMDFVEEPGEAAFYGPKIDFTVRDVIGRKWQLGTVQLDYNLPERFSLEYTGADNKPHQPVMIHRAPFGSMERFMAILIEHYAGAFPVWLAPVQGVMIPVSDRFNAHAEKVAEGLRARGLRVEVDRRDAKLGYKIREAETHKVPYMLIVGEKEVEGNSVSVRRHGKGDQGTVSVSEFTDQLLEEVESKSAA